MLCLTIITVMITLNIPIQGEVITNHKQPDVSWKNYPYHPPGTDIVFPTDEGLHDTNQFPIEWWYADFHLIGQTTGREYGSFVAFYKIQSTVAEKKEVRIFSISDITAEKPIPTLKLGRSPQALIILI